MANRRIPVTVMELAKRDLLPAVPGNRPRASCYKFNYVFNSHRAPATPRTNRHYRMRHLMGLTAFYRNRFYEKDRWYKARIEKPPQYPTCYFIDPFKLTKSLSERLAELEIKDPKLHYPIDIGLPIDLKRDYAPELKEIVRIRKENRAKLERSARLRKLQVDVGGIEHEILSSPNVGAPVIREVAQHYGIFQDLFHQDAYFHAVVPLRVKYQDPANPEAVNPVYYGNVLQAEDTVKQPQIEYNAEKGSFWTLLLTNPDGNLFESDKEIVHWLVANIPENRIADGEVLVDYLQPLPLKGTGYHRLVFVLFRQDNGRIDLSSVKKTLPCKNLTERTFHTPSFYKKFEDEITPAGLSFFQAVWDGSCSQCFHGTLNMQEPIYEYDRPKLSLPPQEEFPTENVSFHEYFDKYRDEKDIEKELFMKRLKKISPFKNDNTPALIRRRQYFPNIFFDRYREDLPSWAMHEKLKENRGAGKYKAIYENKLD